MNSLYVFLAQMALNSFILVLGLCLWKILWADNFVSNVPKGNYTVEGVNFYMDRKEFFKAESFSDVVLVMYRVLTDFNPSYWIENIGFDGYSYLYLQRQCLGFLLTIIGIGLFLLAFEYSMIAANLNPYYYYFVNSIFMPYKYSIFVFFVSALFINQLIFIRKHLQTEYINRLFDRNKYRGLDWMKLRTIHVEGMLFDDLNGAKLRHKINAALENENIFKQVDQLLVIPAYARLLKLELKMRELEYGYQVLQGDDPFLKRIFLNMCLPKKFKDQLKYENKKASLEKKIEQEALVQYQGSGHAIICFDSIEAAQFCLNKFSPNKTIWQIIFESVKQTCNRCFSSSRPISRSRAASYDSDDDLMNHDDFSIICQEVPDPNDIAWLNLEGEMRGIYIWRSCLINIFFVFILLFFSTPGAIFAFVQKYFKIDFFNFQWTDSIPKPFGPLLRIYMPALVVVLLNQFVILLIDVFSTIVFYYVCFSLILNASCRKYYLYLMFNVIIVPAFIMASSDSILEIITGQVTIDLRKSFKRLYTEDHGMVFATIITQSAAISVFVYLNRIGDLFMNYLSTKLTYHRRLFQNEEQSHLREGDEVFQFGYFYSQLLIILSIVFQFMLSSSWILFAGVCYFFLRHCLDGYLLLAVHTREMDSSGNMVKTSLQYAMIGLIFFQAQFFVGFLLKGDIFEMIVGGVLILFSLIIAYILRKPLFEIGLMEDKSIDFSRYNKNTIKAQWRSFYKHPLTISSVTSQSMQASSLHRATSTGFKLRSQKKQGHSQHTHQNNKHRDRDDEKKEIELAADPQQSMNQGGQSHFLSSTSISQNKSRFSRLRNTGFATDTDNGQNTREGSSMQPDVLNNQKKRYQ